VFVAALSIFGIATKGLIDPESKTSKLVKICFFFCLSNYAILVAWKRFLGGESSVFWNPSEKG
jgi:hypothetical protein